MKKIILFFVLVAGIMGMVSCNSKKESREQKVEEFRSELTKEDTVAMLHICDQAMKDLKAKKIDKVLASLYEYTDSAKELKSLSKETENKYRRLFTMFPVLEYERKYYSFQLEGCNDVKYEVVFATAEQAGTEEPAKTAYMFNPVRINGEWKLCVKTADDEFDKEMH